jgi:ubiquinone/menaquinone biosynthesis C-methylase UbiE
MSRDKNAVKMVFGAAAEHYERLIIPAFRPFARAVIDTARPQGDEFTLDVGTGTGILAREIAARVKHVIGVDVAPQMIDAARAATAKENLANVKFQEADTHDLPFPDAHFDLVVASFGLNATSPTKAFPQIRRVMKKGAVLAFHEWGLQDELDTALIDVLVNFMVDDEDADAELLQIRQFVTALCPWHNTFQETDDFLEELAEFTQVEAWEDSPVDCVLPVAVFMDYKLAWPNRRAELNAMPDFQRADCLDALRRTFQEFADRNGNIHYQPSLFRVRAMA